MFEQHNERRASNTHFKCALTLQMLAVRQQCMHAHLSVHAGLLKMVEQEGPAVLFRGLKPAFAFQIAVNGTRLGASIWL